jgi:hypothetical protein
MNTLNTNILSRQLKIPKTTDILLYVLSAISILGYIFIFISPLTFSGYVIIATTTLFSTLVVFQEINTSSGNKGLKLLKMIVPLVLLSISLGTVIFMNIRYDKQLDNIDKIGMFKTLHTMIKMLIVLNSIAFSQYLIQNSDTIYALNILMSLLSFVSAGFMIVTLRDKLTDDIKK